MPVGQLSDEDAKVMIAEFTSHMNIIEDYFYKGNIKLELLYDAIVNITPSTSSSAVIFFTLLALAVNLGISTLPPIREAVSAMISSNMEPYMTYILMSIYSLIFGAAGTCVSNLLDALKDSST